MALRFYDADQVPFGTDPHKSFYDGHIGGVYEDLIYIKNDNSGKYYVNVTVSPVFNGVVDAGNFGDTGFSIKYSYGARRPTEQEWNTIIPGAAVAIPDIGSTSAADTTTYHPIWVRMFVPGGVSAQVKTNISTRIYFYEKNVGS